MRSAARTSQPAASLIERSHNSDCTANTWRKPVGSVCQAPACNSISNCPAPIRHTQKRNARRFGIVVADQRAQLFAAGREIKTGQDLDFRDGGIRVQGHQRAFTRTAETQRRIAPAILLSHALPQLPDAGRCLAIEYEAERPFRKGVPDDENHGLAKVGIAKLRRCHEQVTLQ